MAHGAGDRIWVSAAARCAAMRSRSRSRFQNRAPVSPSSHGSTDPSRSSPGARSAELGRHGQTPCQAAALRAVHLTTCSAAGSDGAVSRISHRGEWRPGGLMPHARCSGARAGEGERCAVRVVSKSRCRTQVHRPEDTHAVGPLDWNQQKRAPCGAWGSSCETLCGVSKPVSVFGRR